MRRCIYCEDDKPEAAFNREHVVPEAFGKFDDNLVLDCVCTSCNTYFGRELDLKLARDTMEGLDRFTQGLKAPEQYKSLGRRATTRVEVTQDGVMKGAHCRLVPSPDGSELLVEPLPQVGFARNAAGPHHRFLLDDLPTKEEVSELTGFVPGTQVHMQFWGTSLEDAWPVLEARGFTRGEKADSVMPEDGPVETEMIFWVSQPEYRAAAKIGFNYFAYVCGAGAALLPNFDQIRSFVRRGVRPPLAPVHLAESLAVYRPEKAAPTRGHFVTAERHGAITLAQVSLMCRLRYIVVLSQDPLHVDFCIRSGHVFDLDDRCVVRVTPPPLQSPT